MKTVINIFLLIIFILLNLNQTTAQDSIKIFSQVLNENRELFIYLPKSYNQSDSSYHVLFILDGGYLINAWPDQPSFAMHIDSLSAARKIPEMIAVGIANVNRLRDFNPTHVDKYPTSGGADRFLDFFHNELIPFIDQNYRTSNKRVLYGHSAGGLLTIYSLLSKPDIFQYYIAASPGLSWDNDYVVNLAETTLPKMKISSNAYLYMSLGEEDYPHYIASTHRLVDWLKQNTIEGLEWDMETYPGLDHAAVAHKCFVEGLQACFSK